jgi:palmitoyl-protein thioesterase
MSGKVLVFLIALCVVCKSKQQDKLPVVMWHGMGDTCCNPLSLGRIQKIIEQALPGIHVHSLKIGDSFADEVLSGYFANINDQVVYIATSFFFTTLHNDYVLMDRSH